MCRSTERPPTPESKTPIALANICPAHHELPRTVRGTIALAARATRGDSSAASRVRAHSAGEILRRARATSLTRYLRRDVMRAPYALTLREGQWLGQSARLARGLQYPGNAGRRARPRG